MGLSGKKRSADTEGGATEVDEAPSASRARRSSQSTPGSARSTNGSRQQATIVSPQLGGASQVEGGLRALRVGMRVTARWSGDGAWYGATVRAIHDDTLTVDVDYDDGDDATGLPLSDVQPTARIFFSGMAFILTGIADEERPGLESTLVSNGGSIAGVDSRSGELCIVEGPGSSSSHEMQRRIADGRVVVLSDPLKNKPIKSTMKLFHGLSLGLTPRRPSWVHECLRERRWVPLAAAHRVALTAGGASVRRGAAASTSTAADAASYERLLADYTIVPIGSDEWRVGWSALLRAAGAEVRVDLPPQQRVTSGEGRTCLLVVEKDAERARVAGPLERASARRVLTASQDWVKHCLLEQRVLEPRRFPVTLK